MLTAGLLVGVVALNAMVVNTTYRLQAAGELERALVEDGSVLEIEVARLSAPSRVAGWASAHGMVLPDADEVIALRVPGPGGNAG